MFGVQRIGAVDVNDELLKRTQILETYDKRSHENVNNKQQFMEAAKTPTN